MTCVTVAGYGCVCSCGLSASQAFAGAISGQAYFALPTQRVNSTYTRTYPVFLLPPDFIQKCPTGQTISRYAFLEAAAQAFAHAEVTPKSLAGKRVGVVVGTSVDASFNCLNVYDHWRQGTLTTDDDQLLADYLRHSTASFISRHFGFAGPFQTVVTACASATDAIGLAKRWIENDVCDAVLCGGTDEINIVPYDGFIRLLVASKTRCKPFSLDRDGINIGEGAGVLLLVNDSLRKSLNLRVNGTVLGYGNCQDGYHPTAPDPSAKGLKKALTFALEESGVRICDVAFINAHGTASPANDAAESVAFREILPGIPVWGSKSVTGHTLGAAGAVEAVLTLEALRQGKIPPTYGFNKADGQIGFLPTQQVTPTQKHVAISDSLAFGGCNSVLVLGGPHAN